MARDRTVCRLRDLSPSLLTHLQFERANSTPGPKRLSDRRIQQAPLNTLSGSIRQSRQLRQARFSGHFQCCVSGTACVESPLSGAVQESWSRWPCRCFQGRTDMLCVSRDSIDGSSLCQLRPLRTPLRKSRAGTTIAQPCVAMNIDATASWMQHNLMMLPIHGNPLPQNAATCPVIRGQLGESPTSVHTVFDLRRPGVPPPRRPGLSSYRVFMTIIFVCIVFVDQWSDRNLSAAMSAVVGPVSVIGWMLF